MAVNNYLGSMLQQLARKRLNNFPQKRRGGNFFEHIFTIKIKQHLDEYPFEDDGGSFKDNMVIWLKNGPSTFNFIALKSGNFFAYTWPRRDLRVLLHHLAVEMHVEVCCVMWRRKIKRCLHVQTETELTCLWAPREPNQIRKILKAEILYCIPFVTRDSFLRHVAQKQVIVKLPKIKINFSLVGYSIIVHDRQASLTFPYTLARAR